MYTDKLGEERATVCDRKIDSILEYVNSKYQDELDRSVRLDQKANSIVTLVGILVTVLLTAQFFTDKLINFTLYQWLLYSGTFGTLLLSLWNSISSYNTIVMKCYPDPDEVLRQYGLSGTELDLKRFLAVRTSKTCKRYRKLNVIKAWRIKISYRCLIVGLFLFFLLASSLVWEGVSATVTQGESKENNTQTTQTPVSEPSGSQDTKLDPISSWDNPNIKDVFVGEGRDNSDKPEIGPIPKPSLGILNESKSEK